MFPHTEKSYEHSIDQDKKVLENEGVKLLWDFSIQTEGKINHNKPDILLLDKKTKTCFIIDVACPFNTRIGKKGEKKLSTIQILNTRS